MPGLFLGYYNTKRKKVGTQPSRNVKANKEYGNLESECLKKTGSRKVL